MYSDFKRENENNLCHSAVRAMGSIGVIVHLDFQNVGFNSSNLQKAKW
jgi:hypothetical protein